MRPRRRKSKRRRRNYDRRLCRKELCTGAGGFRGHRRLYPPRVFSVVLCNNDVDRDHEKFTRRALEELGALFVGKTGIFDHSMKSGDQAARIYATAVVPVPGRKTADGEDLVTLQAKAYMVRTPGNASVSCAMGSAVCSLCGADRRSGGCSHVPGRSYDGKVAFTGTDLGSVTAKVAKDLMREDSQFITLLYGADVSEEQAADVEEAVRSLLPEEVELTVAYGGQPVYYFLISVE